MAGYVSSHLITLLCTLALRYPVISGTSPDLSQNGGPYNDGYYPYQDGYDQGYMSDWSRDRNAWPTGNQAKCVDIPSNLGLCKGIGYNQMRLPNLLGHDTMQEVTQQAANWNPLLGLSCHTNTQLFLCSLFSPVCLDRPIFPCRNLCEAVKEGCEGRMLHYGFPWPDILDCEQFPLGTDLCIGPHGTNQEGTRQCAACDQPNTFEAIVDNYCRADIVIKIKIRRETIEDKEKKLKIGKKKKVYKKGGLKKRDIASIMDLYVNQSEKCDCELPEFNHKDDFYLAMVQRKQDKYYVNAVHLFDKNSTEMKKALRAIRKKSNICTKKGIEVLAVNDDPVVSGEKKDRPRNGGKKSKNNNKASAEEEDDRTKVTGSEGDAQEEIITESNTTVVPVVDNGGGEGEGEGRSGKRKGKNRRNKERRNKDRRERTGKRRDRERGEGRDQV